MSVNITVPALRQPKTMPKEKTKAILSEVQNMIITLKDKKSLVVSSDAYHGIITGREFFKCVFCMSDVELNSNSKELHKKSDKHKNNFENYPHIEEYGENLTRKLDKDNYYCTLCNVVVSFTFLSRHFSTESHIFELEKASIKASMYKPIKYDM